MTDGLATLLQEVDWPSVHNERDLRECVEKLFGRLGVPFRREVDLGQSAGRIDYMVDDVGVELKTEGSVSEVARQVHRYMGCDSVGGVVLLTTRGKHRSVPSVQGKPFRVVVVGGIEKRMR